MGRLPLWPMQVSWEGGAEHSVAVPGPAQHTPCGVEGILVGRFGQGLLDVTIVAATTWCTGVEWAAWWAQSLCNDAPRSGTPVGC